MRPYRASSTRPTPPRPAAENTRVETSQDVEFVNVVDKTQYKASKAKLKPPLEVPYSISIILVRAILPLYMHVWDHNQTIKEPIPTWSCFRRSRAYEEV